jgi:hypothetical protein
VDAAVRLVLSIVLLTLSPMGTHAQTPRIDHVDITEYGLYTASAKGRPVAAPGTATGTVTPLSNMRHTVTTRTVPAQLGVRFGFGYTVVGEHLGTQVSIHSVTIFPSPGLSDPSSSQRKTHSEYDWATTIGEESFRIYTFDSDWEVVPGVWTLQLWYQGRMLAEQKFTIVKQ